MKNAGYSLVEVLVAFAIMASVLTILIPGQTALIRQSNDVGSKLTAQEIALSHLARIGTEVPLDIGAYETQIGSFRLKHHVNQMQFSETDLDQLEIIVTVESSAGRELTRLREIRVLQ